MISRHISIEPENDNYGRLARYIARLGEYAEDKETPPLVWCAGCVGGTDYMEGIAEAQDVQALNTRVTTNKTYHLVVSFRHEDDTKLTPEILQDIERRFAEALGLSEHQRHCAVHTDTQNIHLQVAYNLIHPNTHKRNDHAWDYNKRDALCREIERLYGLGVDNGMEQERGQRNDRAVALEVQQGLQSFDSYVQEHKKTILAERDAAQGWQDLHRALYRHGLEIRPKGNGLIIKNRHSKQAVKASAVDRSLSKNELEKVLGAYVPPMPTLDKEESRYSNKPVQRSPQGEALFARYQAEATERTQQREAAKTRQADELAAIRENWRLKRAELEASTMLKHNRRNMIQYARKKEAAELAKVRARFREEQAVQRFESWNDFLRHQADQGDESALAVLRSKKQAVEVEGPPPAPMPPALDAVKAEYAERQVLALREEDLTRKGKTHLLAYLRMEEMLREAVLRGQLPPVLSVPSITDMTRSVDGKGAVVFTLPGGGKVRDTGKEVLFSGQDELAEQIAVLYARKKWGPRVRMDKGSLVFDAGAGKEKEHEQAAPERPKEGLSR